jgi:hypothetical protein
MDYELDHTLFGNMDAKSMFVVKYLSRDTEPNRWKPLSLVLE